MEIIIKRIIKFLFPELQIVQIFKEKGFIAKKRSSLKQSQMHANQVTQLREDSFSPTPPSNHIDLTKNENRKKQTIEQNNTAAYSHKNKRNGDSLNPSDTFDMMNSILEREIIGQRSYLKQLSIAFKRPFVTGYDDTKPKNVIFVLGNKGTGRKSSINLMAKLLRKNNLTNSSTVFKMDLSSYATISEFSLFLSDLYKCLYGESDVLLFENFEKTHSSVIDVISKLTMTGKYTLSSRYILYDDNLVESTGMLTQNSISELSANGKFFIFTSEKSEQDVFNTFGSKFTESIGDILHTSEFDEAEKMQLVQLTLNSLKSECRSLLSISLEWDENVLNGISSEFKNASGVIGIKEYVNEQIFKPLAEYKLRNMMNLDEPILLSQTDQKFSANINGNIIYLANILPKNNELVLEDIQKELANVIGLDLVKNYVLQLEENLKIQKRREHAGFKTSNVSMHMIFTGNPGTGKTTIARIVAKYLKALGVLSTGQLREVTRADLVGQYVGHTAKITNDVIKSALGGVLFIDEAYALCRDKHDTFGLEAIDTLVKGMEDHRDELVVILAGYSDEMSEFLKVNSGLKSRFPNLIHFEDYTAEEMWEIALITAKTKGYRILNDCRDALIKLFEKRQIKGRNDSGNGRLVRNVIESVILNQSKRLTEDFSAELDVLTYEDFKFEETDKFDLETSLAPIIGLDSVKEFVKMQHKLLIADEKRKKAGLQVDTTQSLNMIFSGNPGTGKTTIARIVATMFKEMGLLKSGHLIETDRGGLVAEYVGHTAKKTEEVFKSALGGVLFIDEAYSLATDGNSFGAEAINTLVKLIEDYRGEIVVILAGYDKEMKDFLKANSGLESRFPLNINFPDYSVQELFQIALKLISAKGFKVDKEAEIVLEEQIYLLHKSSNTHSGNGRMVRNYLDEITRNQSARIATSEVPIDEMNLIISQDIKPNEKVLKSFDLEMELATIIGLEEVKDYIRSLSARLRMQNERKKLGMIVDETQSMHMVFKGNPGTGKTMVARTVAQVLYNIGLISSNKLIETDRADLVAGYVGQTAIKTKEVVMSAMDGVLFIDEAYSLAQGGNNDFGKEAIDTLLKLMDDHRDKIVVIIAGYSEEMDHFLSINPGLKSRFPNIIEFKDYNTEQLMQISKQFFNGRGYVLDEAAKNKLHQILQGAGTEAHFGNGRYVRNIYERAVNNQAIRLSIDNHLTREELMTITDTDIERV
ncbi:AAA family ATPase [Psychrobacillus sp. NPDC058041]|uniref:AAA family ATPase n=1 Tax=Psychrobacillus sp. NPDC058041 TaxID=3346310 RepID=UPI0036DC4423